MKQDSAHAVGASRPWLRWVLVAGVVAGVAVAVAVFTQADTTGATGTTVAAGTAAATGPTGAFVTQAGFQPGATPPCLVHQTALPAASYEDSSGSGSADQLTFVSYYTAAGQLPFCDGRPAGDDDKMWAQLFAKVTGSTSDVSTILG